MSRAARQFLTAVLLGGILALPAARAQTPYPLPDSAPPALATRSDTVELIDPLPDPLPAPALPAQSSAWEPEFLKSLPQPLDQPRSLFQPPAPLAPPRPDLERPYFELDPLLDPPQWPQPGWFADARLDLIHPHVFSNLQAGVTTGLGRQVLVKLGNARLDWTVAPRFEFGYRLPSGFGEFAVSNRFFETWGTDNVFVKGTGLATRTSRLNVNYTDFDYASREFTPWANWSLNWRFGARLAEAFIVTQFNDPFAQAAAGRGIRNARQTNSTVGAGPHIGVEVERRLTQSGLTFVGKLELADTFTRLRQHFSATTTDFNAAGRPDRGTTNFRVFQQVPIFAAQVGVGWRPPSHPNVNLFLGYVTETWWTVGLESDTNAALHVGSRAYFDNQGIVFQAGVNF
ncbi:MAG TPA: hypothetical protein VGY53_09315 [Isosphaeraceae bacterium]|nr:hypothetical protein [Isosphaeraceae bacterium]